MAQILVVKPKTLNDADKKLLRESGVVCVEARNPESVRMLQPEGPSLNGNDLLSCAIKAIASDKFSANTAGAFAKNMAALMKVSNAT